MEETKRYTRKLHAVVEKLENIEGLIRACRQDIQAELRAIMHENPELHDIEA